MNPLNILIFPCGSEVALEIHRSLRFSRHVNIYGASSIADHGRFVFDQYFGNLPFITDNTFLCEIRKLVKKLKIDAIYPAMDAAITLLKENEEYLECKVISSSTETTRICLSKKETYKKLNNIIPTPQIYPLFDEIDSYPVFMKPVIGYGSKGAKKINNRNEIDLQLVDYPNSIVMQYLPGKEYTIDCFTNYAGELVFSGTRIRQRISNGISVNTKIVEDKRFKEYAKKINSAIQFQGAWFFQMKEDESGNLVLMEIASRMGGSSSLYRNKGINFALLSIFDAFGYKLDIVENNYKIELDRALDNKYKIYINYDEVYVDFDDCLIINGKINKQLVSFLFQCINNNKKIILITKHNKDIQESIKQFRLGSIFDQIIQIEQFDQKYRFINNRVSIFIDDSFAERAEVHSKLGIPVFSPDMIESLLEN